MSRIKHLRAIALAVTLVFLFSSMAFAAAPKYVYFQSGSDMVMVDYAKAVNDAMNNNNTLYNAVKQYVGAAEETGAPVIVETDDQKVLDYQKALGAGKRFADIVNDSAYQASKPEAGKELRIENGQPVIGDIQPQVVEISSITPTDTLGVVEIVAEGTTADALQAAITPVCTVVAKEGTPNTYTVTLQNAAYDQEITLQFAAGFQLKAGVNNKVKWASPQLEVISVSAINAKTLKVTFNRAIDDPSAITFDVKRDTVPVSLTPTWAQDKASVELASSVNLLAGTYTVTVGGADFAVNSGSVTVEPQAIASVEIPTNQVVRSSTATAIFKAYDQYGTEITTATRGDFTWTLVNVTDATRSVAVAGSPTDKFLTIDTSGANIGDQIKITGVLNANPSVKVVKTVSVENIYIAKFELGQPILPEGATMLFQNAGYVEIPYTATDNFGNAVKLSTTVNNTADTNSVEGITFLSTDETIVPVKSTSDNFTVDANGKLMFKVLNNAGKVTLTAVNSNTGDTSSITFTVNATAEPSAVQFGQLNQPIIAGDANGTAKLAITFLDQYGNVIDPGATYDLSSKFNIAVVPSTGLIVNPTLSDGKITFQELSATAGNYTLILTNKATGKQYSQNLTVNPARLPNQLSVAAAPTTNLVAGDSTTVKFKVIDQYGKEMSSATGYNIKVTKTSGADTILTLPTNNSTVTIADAVSTGIQVTAGGAGSETVTFTLLKPDGTPVDSKTFSFTVIAPASDFAVTLDKTSYTAGDNAVVTITALDANNKTYTSYAGSGVATVTVTPNGGSAKTYYRNIQFANGVATTTVPLTVADSVGTTIAVTFTPIKATAVNAATTPTVAVGAASKLALTGNANATQVVVTLVDSCGNTVNTYAGTKLAKATYVDKNGTAKTITNADAEGNVSLTFTNGSASMDVSALLASGDKVTVTVDGYTGSLTVQ